MAENKAHTLNLRGADSSLKIDFYPSGTALLFIVNRKETISIGSHNSNDLIKSLLHWTKMNYFHWGYVTLRVRYLVSVLLAFIWHDRELIRDVYVSDVFGKRLISITHTAPLKYFISGSIDFPERQLTVSSNMPPKGTEIYEIFLNQATLRSWRRELQRMKKQQGIPTE